MDEAKISCGVITTKERLSELHEQWNNLVERCTYPSPFRRWECKATWWNWFGVGRTLRILTVKVGEQLVGVLPLYSERQSWLNFTSSENLRILGVGGSTCLEHLGVLVDPLYITPVIDTVVSKLQSRDFRWNAIEFADVASDDIATNLLVDRLSQEYSIVAKDTAVSPYMNLPPSYDQLMQTVEGKTRRKKKYQVRRAINELRAELVTAKSLTDITDKFPELVQISVRSHGRLGRKSPFQNGEYLGFHRQWAELEAPYGIASIQFLNSANGLIAFIYGYQFQGKFYSFQVGFDPRWANYSPGDVLHHLTYESLIDQGACEFDYLRGDEPYKYQFGQQQRNLKSTTVFKWTYSADFANARTWIKGICKKMVRRSV